MDAGSPSPDVTVVIPTRDRAGLVSAVVASALGQEEVSVEVIVVDDGSTDPTPSVLAQLVDPRLRVLRHDVSLGVAAARNRGIELARGAWVAFLDDDDRWSPRKLRAQLDVADAEPGTAFVYASALVVDADGRIDRAVLAPPGGPGLARDLLAGNRVGSPSGVLARTEALRRVGGFDQELAILADWDLWLRLTEVGAGRPCPELLVAYAEHGGNMHLDLDRMLREYRVLRRKHRALARRLGGRVGSHLWWQWIASGYRRRGDRLRAAAHYGACALRYRSRRDLRFAIGMLRGEQRSALEPDFPAGDPPPAPHWLHSVG